jgi:hypothetical protein
VPALAATASCSGRGAGGDVVAGKIAYLQSPTPAERELLHARLVTQR